MGLGEKTASLSETLEGTVWGTYTTRILLTLAFRELAGERYSARRARVLITG